MDEFSCDSEMALHPVEHVIAGEVEREGAGRWESGAGLQQSTVDRVAKGLKQCSANPDSLWQLDM